MRPGNFKNLKVLLGPIFLEMFFILFKTHTTKKLKYSFGVILFSDIDLSFLGVH